MKAIYRIAMLAAAAGLLLGSAACNRIDEVVPVEGGSMFVTVSDGLVATKADIEAINNEEVKKDVQILLFSEKGANDPLNGTLYRKIDLSNGQSSTKIENINVGTYTVVAYLNGRTSAKDPVFDLDTVKTLASMRNLAVSLASSIPGAQFTMYGETSGVAVVNGRETGAEVKVKRFVSRIRLVSVTLSDKFPQAYGNFVVDQAFVTNGFSSWKFAGSDGDQSVKPADMINVAGRQKDKFASTSTADFISAESHVTAYGDFGKQTFLSYGDAGKTVERGAGAVAFGDAFYIFPNENANDEVENGEAAATFNGPVTEANIAALPARLVVYGHFTGDASKKFYYPVTIGSMQRNHCYDVRLTVAGFGSEDPNAQVTKGSIDVTVNVEDWEQNHDIPKEI